MDIAYSTVHHFQNLILNGIQILGIPSRGTANDIVNLDVIILTSHTT